VKCLRPIFLGIICSFLFTLPPSVSAESTTISDNLPLDVQVDLLMTELSRLLKIDDNEGIIALIPRIRALDIEIPDSLYFLEARALFRIGKALTARDQLVVYLANTGRDGRYYEQATELLLAVKEEADIQERKQAEQTRLRRIELAKSIKKARNLRIREAQRNLQQLGFRLAVENGEFNNPTREALAVYQIRHGLQVNGDITDETLEKLKNSVPESHNCDGLARYASKPQEWGIPISQIPAQVAVTACNEALRQFPEVIRFQIQYARSLLAAGRANDALAAIEPAARLGYPAAEYLVASMHERGLLSANSKPDMANALRWYKYAQAKQYPRALLKMAGLTEQGKAGISRSSAAATKLYLQAADLGHPPALVIAGNKYVSGRGVKRDYAKALHLYTSAAELSYPEAEFKVGEMYERGRGVKRNKTSAKAWYRRASAQGHAAAQLKLERLDG
jgi:TPR repeat protein|tara:strand:+ start:7055 stop:8404 length:1350 start_codon:yes stop_codon:yes gene_type:complete